MLIRHFEFKNTLLGWDLDDSRSAGADVEWVDAEPQVGVNDGSEKGWDVAEDSENEQDHENTVDDQISDHLPGMSLQSIDKSLFTNILRWSTYALRSQQQLVRKVAVDDEKNKQDDRSGDAAASGHSEGEPVAEVVSVKDQSTDHADNSEKRDDHAPPGHDDAADLELKAEQKLF